MLKMQNIQNVEMYQFFLFYTHIKCDNALKNIVTKEVKCLSYGMDSPL